MEGLHSNDQMLPVGTYFYVIDYVNGTGVTINKAGYIYIEWQAQQRTGKVPVRLKHQQNNFKMKKTYLILVLFGLISMLSKMLNIPNTCTIQ
jgi:cellobiose phosphorylase